MAIQTIETIFKLKRGKLVDWENKNPVLAQGEPGYVLDTNQLKIGDGQTPWKDLPFLFTNIDLNNIILDCGVGEEDS